jgi:hypothetical protein
MLWKCNLRNNSTYKETLLCALRFRTLSFASISKSSKYILPQPIPNSAVDLIRSSWNGSAFIDPFEKKYVYKNSLFKIFVKPFIRKFPLRNLPTLPKLIATPNIDKINCSMNDHLTWVKLFLCLVI